MEKVTFKVKMDKDSVAEEITLNVDFDGVADELIRKHAMANMVVVWQGQIRTHWTEYKEGKMPDSTTFGVPLFAGKRGGVTVVKKVTLESAKKWANEGTELEQLLKKIDLLEGMGIDVPIELLDRLDILDPQGNKDI